MICRAYKRMIFQIFFVLIVFSVSANAGVLTVGDKSNVRIYGFFDYETGYNNNSRTPFFGSNTAFLHSSSSYYSREQVRLGFVIKGHNLVSNITMDSWPKDFNLMLGFVKHKLSRHFAITIGRDWSIVNFRYFKYSSYTLRPYVVGFQGSKRTNQLKITYFNDFGDFALKFSTAFEDRLREDGVVEGKNKMSNSMVNDVNSNIFAWGLNAKLYVNTGLGKPSELMAFYEVSPAYIYGNFGRKRVFPYVLSAATKININKIFFILQDVYEYGMTGIVGIKGNRIKDYSFIYKNHKFFSRKSNTIGFEIGSRILRRLFVVGGYTSTIFHGEKFLKGEMKSSDTLFLSSVISTTRITKLIILYSYIKNKIASNDNIFSTKRGYNFVVAYRYYF